jgi:lipooligosaccharide transport system permease protein
MTDVAPRNPAVALPPRTGLLLRMIPATSYVGRARTLVQRAMLTNSRAWLPLVSGFFEPVFYLLALGVGFGRLVSQVTGPTGAPISYTAFVAPALLASSAMNGAVFDATFNIFHKLKYVKLYDSILATPLGPVDITFGEISWALLRGALYSVAFLSVMAVLGLITTPWALLAFPVAMLIALAFAAIGMGATTFMRSWQDFDLVNIVILPMFFFSTTFYPLSVYPRWLQIVVECLPLYQGVAMMRALTIGGVDVGILGHVAYFVAMTVVGGVVAGKRLRTLLLK